MTSTALRETASRALLAVLWLHVPIAVVIGMTRGADWLLPAVLMVAMAMAATLSWRAAGQRTFDPPRSSRSR